MRVSYSENSIVTNVPDSLAEYRAYVRKIWDEADYTKPESAIVTTKDGLMRAGVYHVTESLGEVDHVVLVGIGGSSLGIEVFYEFLETEKKLYILDSVSPHNITETVNALSTATKDRIAICVISKSGGTTETLANAEVLLSRLEEVFQEPVYDRTVFIGNSNNPLLSIGEEKGIQILPMHEAVGGRYSVFTAVGLVPMLLLGYDVEEVLKGAGAVMDPNNELVAANGAAVLHAQLKKDFRSVNFFALDARLNKLGFWYRQLAAESLGKAKTKTGQKNNLGFIPTVSTAIDLHSIGQLYFSGFPGVFTDFVNFTPADQDYLVKREASFAKKLSGKSLSQIQSAISDGVVEAYKESALPFRTTTLENNKTYELGLFMGVRMLETMYLANLMVVDAFNQPNVELYKEKTREILDS